MKKLTFLTIVLALSAASLHTYGQELERNRTAIFPGEIRRWGFLDKTTREIVIPHRYENARDFSEGLAAVQHNSRWGFIDKTGKEIISYKYQRVEDFSEELAAVQFNNRWGFIDKTGVEVIPHRYKGVRSFEDGAALVLIGEGWGAIDKTGTLIMFIPYGNPTAVRNAIRTSQIAERKRIAGLFSTFAQNYVDAKINEWQQRGEFERTVDWEQRVNENARAAKAAELLKEAEQAYIAEGSKNIAAVNLPLGAYDADKEVFRIHDDWLLPVPIGEAPNFRDNWNNHIRLPQFVISDDRLAIAGMAFTTANGKTYQINNQDNLIFVDYNLAPVETSVAEGVANIQQGQQNISMGSQEQQQQTAAESRNRSNVANNLSDRRGETALGAHLAYSGGIGFGTMLRTNLSNFFRLQASLTYFTKKNSENVWGSTVKVSESAWDLSMNGHFLFSISNQFTIYPLSGLGFSILSGAAAVDGPGLSAKAKESITSVALNAGFGFDIRLSEKIVFNNELKYALGSNLSYLSFLSGIVFIF